VVCRHKETILWRSSLLSCAKSHSLIASLTARITSASDTIEYVGLKNCNISTFPSVLFYAQKYSRWIRRCSRRLWLHELLLSWVYDGTERNMSVSNEREDKAHSLIRIILSCDCSLWRWNYEETCTPYETLPNNVTRRRSGTSDDDDALCTRCITKSPNAPSATIEVIHIQCTL